MSSLDIVEGGIFEESREWPHHQRALKSSPKLCRLIDIFAQPRSKRTYVLNSTAVPRGSSPLHARHEANAHQRAQVLRSQPQLGARVEQIQQLPARSRPAVAQGLPNQAPRELSAGQHDSRERAPARRLRGRRPYACGVLITSRRWRRGRPHSRGSVSAHAIAPATPPPPQASKNRRT